MIKSILTRLLAVALCLLPTQSGAYWQSVSQQVTDQDFSQTDDGCLAVSGTTQSFTNKRVGNGTPSRVTVVSINWSDSTLAGTSEVTGVTIGGNAAARAIRSVGDNQNSNSEVWYVANPTGTTATIDVTSSTAVDGMTIAVYRLTNFTTAPIITATGTTTASATVATGMATLAAASRRVNVSTSLSNLTNNFSSACGTFLWGVHASNNTANGSLSTTISPTSDTPLIAMAVWVSELTSAPLDGIAGVTGAWSFSRNLLSAFGSGTRYTTSGPNVTGIADQTGNSRTFGSATGTPALTTTGPNSIGAINFDAINTAMSTTGVPISTFITASAGYVIISGEITAVSTNNASVFDNDAIFADTGTFIGMMFKNNAGAYTTQSYNWDGSADGTAGVSITLNTAYVFEWRHDGGNVYVRVNKGTWTSVASGNTTTLTGVLVIGAKVSGTAQYIGAKIGEMAVFNVVPNDTTKDTIATKFMTQIGAM